MAKVSVEKVELARYEVEFPLDEVRKQLRFTHNGKEMALPYNAILSYVGPSPETGPPKLIASFELDVTPAEPSGLTQIEVDVWGMIRTAGEEGITYQRVYDLMEGGFGRSMATIQKAVKTLTEKGLVENCGKEQPVTNHSRKLWRSVE